MSQTVCLIAMLLFLPVSMAVSQEHGVLRAPWIHEPPTHYIDETGTQRAFSTDLTRALGEIVGFDVEPVEQTAFRGSIESMEAGKIDIIAGTANVERFSDNVVISDRLIRSKVYLFARTSEMATRDDTDLKGKRIGKLGIGPLHDGLDLFRDSELVSFETYYEMVVAIITGEVDFLIAPHEQIALRATALGLSGRIEALGSELWEVDRFVVLHKSKSHLLPLINDAIAEIQNDGRLEVIAQTYQMDVGNPVPDVLVVGILHDPPYQVIEPSGTFGGFAVEAITEIAQRAALRIRFEEIDETQYRDGPAFGTYDLLPQSGITPDRAARMLFSQPIDRRNTLSIMVRADESRTLTSLNALEGLTVGVQQNSPAQLLLENAPDVIASIATSQHDLFELLVSGAVDAVITEPLEFLTIARNQIEPGSIREVTPPVRSKSRAIALRPGLDVALQRINAVIPGYIISPEYRASRDSWFGQTVFWTPRRIYIAAAIGGALVLMALLFALYDHQRQRNLKNLAETNARIVELNEELQRSNSDLEDFAYVASHDLKEPLRGISINADFVLREEVPENVKKRLLRVVSLSHRMEQLVSDLLYFSRLGRGDIAQIRVDPNEVVENINTELLEMLAECNGKIVVETELPDISAEPAKVKTVLQNLIVNGLKYNNSDQKVVTVGFMSYTMVEGEEWRDVFYVTDNGIGIDDKYHDKIFKIFNRLHRESDFGAGTGAGLSFVKKIIEYYGKRISVESMPGGGTTFYFSFPLHLELRVKTMKKGNSVR